MTKLPQRPRSHRLESEARRHFAGLIEGHGWVVRALDKPDYGIDDAVEVFDGDSATGLSFYVQSRGTDTELPKGLKVHVGRAQQNYFAAFNDPVLIVRYHAPTHRTLAKWFHAVDPYPRTETQTITLSLEDELAASTVEQLAAEVRRVRALKSPRLPWPVSLSLQSDEWDTRQIELEISSILSGLTDTIRLVPDGSEDVMLRSRVAGDQIIVHAGLASHTIHGLTTHDSVRRVAGAVVHSAGLVLDELGHGSHAADLFEAKLLDHGMPVEPLQDVATRLGRARRMDVVFRLVDNYRARGDARYTAAAFLLLTASTAALPRGTGDRRRAAAILEEIAGQLGDPHEESELRAAVNLSAARIRFSITDWADADRNFLEAVRLGADATKPELLAELAGAAHEAGAFGRAVELYDRAICLAPEHDDLLPRRADSLSRQGRLHDAVADLKAYLRNRSKGLRVALLRLEALEFLIDSGVGDGEPDPAAADKRLSSADATAQPDEEVVSRCLAAAGADPWHVAAWNELGQHQASRGSFSLAYGPLTIVGLITRSPEAWARLFITAWRGRNESLAETAIAMGAGDHGDAFHSALRFELGSANDAQRVADAADGIDRNLGRFRRSEGAGFSR